MLVSALKSLLERQRQGDLLFEGSLGNGLYNKFRASHGYLVRSCPKPKHRAEGLRNSEVTSTARSPHANMHKRNNQAKGPHGDRVTSFTDCPVGESHDPRDGEVTHLWS